jgi:hypothetical protein
VPKSRGIRTRRGLQMETIRAWVATRDRGTCWEWPYGKDHHGYGTICVIGERRKTGVHRLAHELAYGQLKNDACHLCNNPSCCNPDHVYDGTALENHLDSVRQGRHVPPPKWAGESHPMAKLSSEQVVMVRQSSLSAQSLARQLGVTDTLIYLIRQRKIWKSVA